jgi:putative DNA primase/helicase
MVEEEYIDDMLNWEQTKSISLEVENKLPELAEELKIQGRQKQHIRILDDIHNEERDKEKLKEDYAENEELKIYKQFQEEYENKNNKLSNELYLLQMRVMKKLAEKKGVDGATELLVEYIKNKNYIHTTKDDLKSEMWIYEDGIYIPNGRSVIREFCRKVLDKAYNSYLSNVVLSKIETDTYITQEDFFDNKYIEEIPVQNGILNVLTKKIIPFNPKKIFFIKLPVNYNPSADNPNIEKFLKDILDKEEDLSVVYEVIGSGLYKDYFTEKACMLVGSGRNGKSKLLELIKRLVGIENCCCVPIRSMKEENSSLCELYGRLFNLAGDLSGGDLKDTGVFKQTVGRDTLQTHRKFLRDLIFVNYAKHLFACNELPRVFDTTDGFWDKWILLKFPYKFVTQEEFNKLSKEEQDFHKIKNPDIINNISTPEELSGLLNKAIDGLHRLLKQKNYSQTKGTKEIKDFWIRNSDSFTAFCIDCIKEGNIYFITKRELRRQFNIYCKKFNLKGAGDKSIKATLEDRYGVIESRKLINDEQQYVWEGINFKWNL